MKIAIIPARGGSKRIPGKNIKNFFGKPIIAYSIEAARQTGLFDEIIVSTDDHLIAETAQRFGATVPFMRPSSFADDHAPIMDVLRHAVDWYAERERDISHICCVYATAPFVQAADLLRGYQLLDVDGSGTGSSMAVAKFTYPIQRALQLGSGGSLEMIDKTHLLTRSQDLPEAYMDAAQFIWTTPGAVAKCTISLLEGGVVPVVIPTSRVQDIDTLEDWDRAEMLFRTFQDRAGNMEPVGHKP